MKLTKEEIKIAYDCVITSLTTGNYASTKSMERRMTDLIFDRKKLDAKRVKDSVFDWYSKQMVDTIILANKLKRRLTSYITYGKVENK